MSGPGRPSAAEKFLNVSFAGSNADKPLFVLIHSLPCSSSGCSSQRFPQVHSAHSRNKTAASRGQTYRVRLEYQPNRPRVIEVHGVDTVVAQTRLIIGIMREDVGKLRGRWVESL